MIPLVALRLCPMSCGRVLGVSWTLNVDELALAFYSNALVILLMTRLLRGDGSS